MLTTYRLEQMDTRQIWPHEANDFTPWLASNLCVLGEALGMDLQSEDEEVSIGTFRADIVARDLRTNTSVLIENQLDRTDHSHLGQIITYAAGLKASTVIWIAKRFCDEHLAALDWLNEVSTDVQFFGVQIEAWRINDAIAPKFNVVSRPNSWMKRNKRASHVKRFNQTQFVLNCLKESPDMLTTEMRRRASELRQTLSDPIISMARKEFRTQVEEKFELEDGPITGEFEKIVVNE